MIMKTKQTTNQNVEIAKTMARRMWQPTVQDRIGLAREGLLFLKKVEMVNGEVSQVVRAAGRLANALEKFEYPKAGKGLEAAGVVSEIRSFISEIKPMAESACLS